MTGQRREPFEGSTHGGPSGHASGTRPVAKQTEGSEGLDLSPEQQAQIAHLFSELRSLDFYDLLGVPRTADKKTIKRAYNERAVRFHPDRFFRKRLGSFAQKMEAIFSRMTEAHDTLCSAERRAEYDAGLAPKRSSLVEALLEEAAAEMAGSSDEARHEAVSFVDLIEVQETLPAARAAKRGR